MLFVLRGIKFQADLPDGPSRGYVCENYGLPLRQVEHQDCRADLEDRFNFTRPGPTSADANPAYFSGITGSSTWDGWSGPVCRVTFLP